MRGKLHDFELVRIVELLKTDTSIPDIARRMERSRSTVVHVNRDMKIRQYAGRRNSWKEIDHERAS